MTRRINKAGLFQSHRAPRCRTPARPSRPCPAPSGAQEAGGAGGGRCWARAGGSPVSQSCPATSRVPAARRAARSPPTRTPQPTHRLPPLLAHAGTELPNISTPAPSLANFLPALPELDEPRICKTGKQGRRAGGRGRQDAGCASSRSRLKAGPSPPRPPRLPRPLRAPRKAESRARPSSPAAGGGKHPKTPQEPVKVPGTPSEEVTLPGRPASSCQLLTACGPAAPGRSAPRSQAPRRPRGPCARPRALVPLDAHAAPRAARRPVIEPRRPSPARCQAAGRAARRGSLFGTNS